MLQRDKNGKFISVRVSTFFKDDIEYKKCTKCGIDKILKENFYNQKRKLKSGKMTTIYASECKECSKKRSKEKSIKYKDYYTNYRIENKEKINKKHRKDHRKKRLKWIKWLSEIIDLKCKKCGYDKYFEPLDFHHDGINGSKETELWRIMKKAFNDNNKKMALIELKKGYFLCSNCHREEHIKEKILIEDIKNETTKILE